jgi:rubrerythrin
MKNQECLPIAEVLATMQRVENDVAGFYRSAIELTMDQETRDLFRRLTAEKQDSIARLAPVCDSLACGESELDKATDADLVFLSSLAQTAFYRQAGNPAELASAELRLQHLVENALKLEKDLLLFYIRFYGVSCADHRPLMAELIKRGESHVGQLTRLRARLARP